jgi:hypothetical protein
MRRQSLVYVVSFIFTAVAHAAVDFDKDMTPVACNYMDEKGQSTTADIDAGHFEICEVKVICVSIANDIIKTQYAGDTVKAGTDAQGYLALNSAQSLNRSGAGLTRLENWLKEVYSERTGKVPDALVVIKKIKCLVNLAEQRKCEDKSALTCALDNHFGKTASYNTIPTSYSVPSQDSGGEKK